MLNLHIEVTRTRDLTHKEVWEFSFIDNSKPVLQLTKYSILERPTTRHKFKAAQGWNYYSSRAFNERPDKKQVPVPADVVNEAKTKFIQEMSKVEVVV